MNRRGFLGSILALGAAPAIVRADSLMRIVAPETLVEVEAIGIASPTLTEIITITLERNNELLRKLKHPTAFSGGLLLR